MPFDEVVKSGEPDFPFCLGWALHDWTTKTWEKGSSIAKDTMIFKQEFPGEEDDIKHFYRLLDAFKDKRYIKVDGKLLFSILVPRAMPEPKRFMDLWNRLAKENGLPGFHFVGIIDSMPTITKDNINYTSYQRIFNRYCWHSNFLYLDATPVYPKNNDSI